MAIIFVAAPVGGLNFGNVAVGNVANGVITLQNNNNSIDAIVLSEIFAGANPAQFTFQSISPANGIVAHQGGQALVTIRFTPAAIASYSATIQFHYDNGVGGTNTTAAFPMTGAGVSGGVPANEVASLLQSFRELLVPSQGATGKVLSYYDTVSLDDINDSATYTYKSEDIVADRVPTVRRVVITYIDLGVATLNVSVTAINDNGVVVTQQATITIGSVAATGVLATAYADIQVTGYRPQITLFRAASGGPIAISHVMATGTIEKGVTL